MPFSRFECVHRRQLLAARALNERSLLLSGLPFSRMRTTGDVYIDDLVILSVLHFSDVHVDSSTSEVQRIGAFYDFKCEQMRERQYTLGRVSGETRRWHLRDTGVPC